MTIDLAEPVIGLAESRYTVKEPMFKEESAKLTIPVVRQGDLSQIEVVTINTKDGQANAGKDYNGFFKGLVFALCISVCLCVQVAKYTAKKKKKTTDTHS